MRHGWLSYWRVTAFPNPQDSPQPRHHLRFKGAPVSSQDFDDFHYILAMDHSNYRNLQAMAPSKKEGAKAPLAKLQLFRNFDPEVKSEENIPDVPDPYYGGLSGFENVQAIVWRTAKNLLEYLIKEHGLT